jgi:hypothetical protein
LIDGQPREREELVAGFLQAGRDGFGFVAPFADEGLVLFLDGLMIIGIDHIGVVGRNLVGEPFRRVCDQVPELVRRAAPHGQIGPQRHERLLQSGRAVDSLDLAQRVLETAVSRLRRQRRTALGAAADGELHQRIVPQPVVAPDQVRDCRPCARRRCPTSGP